MRKKEIKIMGETVKDVVMPELITNMPVILEQVRSENIPITSGFRSKEENDKLKNEDSSEEFYNIVLSDIPAAPGPIPLADSFCKSGFRYDMILKSDKAFLYSQRDIADDMIVGYVVFKYRINKEWNCFGKIIPASVAFPSGEAFGGWAWCHSTREFAESKFSILNENGLMFK